MIRPETPSDHEAIRHVNRLAFGQEEEARLVDALRDGGFLRASLVADVEGQIVGHILFSDLPIIAEAGTIPALALAPMAVVPKFQGQGIGTALVRRGLEVCRRQGHQIVVVLGHPHFYPRFGFSAILAQRLASPYSGEAFMALELMPGALDGIAGRVIYPPPFGAFGAGEEVEQGAKTMNHEQLISNYLSGAGLVRNAVAGMNQEQLLAKPVPGKWSTHQVVCHLADTEALYAERMRRVIAEQEPPLLSIDPDAWMARLACPERVVEDDLRLIELIRSQMARILRTLKPEDFQRRGTHSADGSITLETVLVRITEHLPHHVRFIHEKKKALASEAKKG